MPRWRSTGYVSDARLDALYRGADVLAYPSLYEGFGLPLLEAMARGTPVVASRATVLPETGGDAALYFDPLDVGDIAQTLGRVLGEGSLRDDLVARGRARVARFSWEKTAAATLAVYEAVATPDENDDPRSERRRGAVPAPLAPRRGRPGRRRGRRGRQRLDGRHRRRSSRARRANACVSTERLSYAAAINRGIAASERRRGAAAERRLLPRAGLPRRRAGAAGGRGRRLGRPEAPAHRRPRPRRAPRRDRRGGHGHRPPPQERARRPRPSRRSASTTRGEAFGADGAAALYRRETLDDCALGAEVLDEDLALWASDVDLAWRARMLGWRCAYEPRAVAYHVRTYSPSTRGRLPKRDRRIQFRNRYLMMAKNDTAAGLVRDLHRVGRLRAARARLRSTARSATSAWLLGRRPPRPRRAAPRARRSGRACASGRPCRCRSRWSRRRERLRDERRRSQREPVRGRAQPDLRPRDPDRPAGGAAAPHPQLRRARRAPPRQLRERARDQRIVRRFRAAPVAPRRRPRLLRRLRRAARRPPDRAARSAPHDGRGLDLGGGCHVRGGGPLDLPARLRPGRLRGGRRRAASAGTPGSTCAATTTATSTSRVRTPSACVEHIDREKPDMLLVGMGTPQQELWVERYFDRIDASVVWTVGALFDYLSKRIPRAPHLMSDNGLEWVFRLVMEPRRLWRRYLIGNPVFLSRVIAGSAPPTAALPRHAATAALGRRAVRAARASPTGAREARRADSRRAPRRRASTGDRERVRRQGAGRGTRGTARRGGRTRPLRPLRLRPGAPSHTVRAQGPLAAAGASHGRGRKRTRADRPRLRLRPVRGVARTRARGRRGGGGGLAPALLRARADRSAHSRRPRGAGCAAAPGRATCGRPMSPPP